MANKHQLYLNINYDLPNYKTYDIIHKKHQWYIAQLPLLLLSHVLCLRRYCNLIHNKYIIITIKIKNSFLRWHYRWLVLRDTASEMWTTESKSHCGRCRFRCPTHMLPSIQRFSWSSLCSDNR